MEKQTEKEPDTTMDLSINRLNFIKRNPNLSLIIVLIILNLATAKLFIDHLIKDIDDQQKELLKKDEVIKMWRDLKIESDRAEEYSKRNKDTVYVR